MADLTDDSQNLKAKINKCFSFLSQEANELYLDKVIPRLESPPSPVEFYRNFVSSNKPVIIKNLINDWPAVQTWCPDYFREKIGSVKVTATVTPNGYADAVFDGKFVMPEERSMTMSDFLNVLDTNSTEVFYIQKQNSNLTEEFQSIIQDVSTNLPLGRDAFGKEPDAVNFWMGDGRAVTSMHRDHYENLYCVISGWKKFLLIPPTDLPFIPYESYVTGVYKQQENGEWLIEDDPNSSQVPWIAVDPLNPDVEKYPEFKKANIREITVFAGETLYLPSLWFHHVQQSHGCIAVNYWYDMEFDIKYNYYQFLDKLKSAVK